MARYDPKADSCKGYHQFVAEDGERYGSFEVFWLDDVDDDADASAPMCGGWFWWPCFAGCLPEHGPIGPFASSREAMQDARGM